MKPSVRYPTYTLPPCNPLACKSLPCNPLACNPLPGKPSRCHAARYPLRRCPVANCPLSCNPLSCTPLPCAPLPATRTTMPCSPFAFNLLVFNPLLCSPLPCTPLPHTRAMDPCSSLPFAMQPKVLFLKEESFTKQHATIPTLTEHLDSECPVLACHGALKTLAARLSKCPFCLGLALSRKRHAPAVAPASPRHPHPLRWQTHLQPPEATNYAARTC